MLAVGSFERLDGIPNLNDLTVAEWVSASATYDDLNTSQSPDAQVNDPDPNPAWQVNSTDDPLVQIPGAATAVVPDALAHGNSNTVASVLTPIGANVAAPHSSLSAIQMALASAMDVEDASGALISRAQAGATAASEALSYTRFRFDAPTGEENDPFLYRGFIHIAAGGLAVRSGTSEGPAIARTQLAFPNNPNNPNTPGTLLVNGMRVWRDGTLLAEAFVSGSAFQNLAGIDTGLWTVWGQVLGLDGILTPFSQIGSSAQALVPFMANLSDGDVITYDADPRRSPNGNPDNGGVGGFASASSEKSPTPNIPGIADAGTLQVVNAWGFADPFVTPAPVLPAPIFTNPIQDVNGDGVLDQDDIQQLFDANDLVVTVATDVDNGNYDFSDLSLREALSLAVDGDRIIIAPWVENILVSSELLVNKDVQINGFGADSTSLDGGDATRVLRVQGATVSISGLTIKRGNTTGSGGGIFFGKGHLTLNDVEVVDNYAAQDGGGVFVGESQSFQITGSTIAENTTAGDGGGIFLEYGIPSQIENSTISGNQASSGGGVFIGRGGSTVDFRNVTVTQNTITTAKLGGGIYNQDSAVGKQSIPATNVRLDNTIAVANTNNSGNANNLSGGDDGAAYDKGSSYNLIGVGGPNNFSAGNGNQLFVTPAEAALAPLANYGGSTRTHALLAGSFALDRGSDIVAGSEDQRGFTRPVDLSAIPNGSGGAADVGAYEAEDGEFGGSLVSSLIASSDTTLDVGGVGEETGSIIANASRWYALHSQAVSGGAAASNSIRSATGTGDMMTVRQGSSNTDRSTRNQVERVEAQTFDARGHALAATVGRNQLGLRRLDVPNSDGDYDSEIGLVAIELAFDEFDHSLIWDS